MAKKQHLKFLRISLLILLPILSQAQSWEKVKEINIDKAPTSCAVDYQGNFYLGYADGGLSKYDSKGVLLENFSLSNTSSISLIDVQNNLKPFLFYFDNQQITILDRFSSVPKNYQLADFGIQLGMMACPAPDGDFWIAENNPQRLKKINPNRKSTVLEIQVSLGDSLIKMQAYQNLVFVAHKNGLHTFDQYGGKLYSVSMKNLLSIQVAQGRLYLFSDEKIILLDPATGKLLSEERLPQVKLEGMMKVSDYYLVVNKRKLTFFNFKE